MDVYHIIITASDAEYSVDIVVPSGSIKTNVVDDDNSLGADYSLDINVPPAQIKSVLVKDDQVLDARLFTGYIGPRGPKGDSGSLSLTIQFPSPLLTWTATHNLGRKPSVEVYTPGGMMIFASVLHLNDNAVQITFDEAQAGFVVIT